MRRLIFSRVALGILLGHQLAVPRAVAEAPDTGVKAIVGRVAAHSFHPIRDGFTYDRELDTHGVANLGDADWRVRLLAARDLVRLGEPAATSLVAHLHDRNEQVRQVVAMTLGIIRATNATAPLAVVLRDDPDTVVRSQAAIALGQIGSPLALPGLRAAQAGDDSKDVQHQAELAIHAIENGKTATPDLARAYAGLDESRFGRAKVGSPAPTIDLTDTRGGVWRLADFRGRKAVVLIWVFADWCPVCHGEFHELMELRDEFKAANIEVATLECHDLYPCRVMVGQELEPKYWFSKTSFREAYTKSIWWPHLVDRAGAVGAEFGVQPLAFTVHSEWINRPSVVIVDPSGIIRFAYFGTFWGDRPPIRKILEMVRTDTFEFTAPKRLVPKTAK